MNKNISLLNYVFQNSRIGIESNLKLMPKIKNMSFQDHIKDQLTEYRSLSREAAIFLNELGFQEKELSSFSKMKNNMNISMKTMFNRSPSYISEIMFKESTNGTICAIKNRRKYAGCDQRYLELNERLLRTEEKNLENLKSFL